MRSGEVGCVPVTQVANVDWSLESRSSGPPWETQLNSIFSSQVQTFITVVG